VARVLDYSKYKYEQALKQKQARKHQQQITVREIKFRPKIAQHDYDTKRGHVKRFLLGKAKVKITIMFRGREVAHPERGVAILDRLAEELSELAVVEQSPTLDGRNMAMLLAPSKIVLSGHVDGAHVDGAHVDGAHDEGEPAAANGDVADGAVALDHPELPADSEPSPAPSDGAAGLDAVAHETASPPANGLGSVDDARLPEVASTEAKNGSEPASGPAPEPAAPPKAPTTQAAPKAAKAERGAAKPAKAAAPKRAPAKRSATASDKSAERAKPTRTAAAKDQKAPAASKPAKPKSPKTPAPTGAA
jgi:translation initiation factor IF-3